MDLPVTVGVNGTEGSNLALRSALAEAGQRQRELHLVVAYGFAAPTDTELDALWAARHDAQQHLRRALEIVNRLTPQTAVVANAVAGDVVSVLVSESKGSGLLVIGSRQLHRIGSVVKASVGTQLCAAAVIPTMVVLGPGSDAGDAPVVAGVDGSAVSPAVIRFAAAEAERRHRPLRLVSCLDPAESRPRISGQHRVVAALIDQAAVEPAFAAAAAIEIELADPVESLIAHSHDAAMVVVGRTGVGRPDRASGLGSVSSRLLRRARCPIVVVPPACA